MGFIWTAKLENGETIMFQSGVKIAKHYGCSVRCLYNRIGSGNKNKSRKFKKDIISRQENVGQYESQLPTFISISPNIGVSNVGVCDTCDESCDEDDIICDVCNLKSK